jgi:hypothetical protein
MGRAKGSRKFPKCETRLGYHCHLRPSQCFGNASTMWVFTLSMEILHIQQGELACTQGTQFFFFGEGGGCWIFLHSHCVPNKLSESSQKVPQVPNVFPNMFTLLCPIWFALTSSLVTYISSPKEETTTVYIYLGTVQSLIKKILCWVNQRCPSQKKKLHWGLWRGLHN